MSASYAPFAGLRSGDKVLLAFSGGVDSTIAAHLAKDAGLDVLAVCMRFLPGPDKSDEVRLAADALGIELRFLDLQNEFRREVMEPCWNIFESGKTPNPCALCNPVFKFGHLMDFAKANHCRKLITGHYARLQDQVLSRGVHREKDQSYFLFALTPEQLAFSAFPLGDMTKDQVREIADRLGLPNSKAKESQDACFSPSDGRTLAEMLQAEFSGKIRKGHFICADNGKFVGCHKGIHAYTIGQRKGLGVALGKPAYVKKIDNTDNRIYITTEDTSLFSSSLTVEHLNWQQDPAGENPFHAQVQIRYRSPAVPAWVRISGDGSRAEVTFETPVRAVTPGQAAVFYRDEAVLGGGFIR